MTSNAHSQARGCFLSLEGLEGVGKTTNLEFIKARLDQSGIDLLVTREPGGTPIGELLRELVLHRNEQVSAETELLMVTAARKQHVTDVIEPALQKGRWVLSDRFTDASFAYQGGGRKLGAELVAQLHQLMGISLQPDLTLLLDMSVEAGLQRMQARGEPDRIEKEAMTFFEQARNGYLERAKAQPGRVKIIDASQSLEAVQHDIAAVLDQFTQLHAASTA